MVAEKSIFASIIQSYTSWDELDDQNFQLNGVSFNSPDLQDHNGCSAAFLLDKAEMQIWTEDGELVLTKKLILSLA